MSFLPFRALGRATAALLRFRSTKPDVIEKTFLDAAQQDNIEACIRCLNAGVNPNCRFPADGYTALHYAAERGDIILGLKLVACPNIILDPKSTFGYTPLHIACRNEQVKMVKFLVKNGANPNAVDRFSKTSLHMVVMLNSIAMAQILLKHGANVNAVDTMNNTPLHLALLVKCFLPMVKLLLQYGADPNLNVGSMPLFLECVFACHKEPEMEATLILLDHGVNVNVTDRIARRNAFHFVAITGYVPMAAQLLQRGCDPFKEDFLGRKPIDIASMHENEGIVDLLEAYMYPPEAPRNTSVDSGS